MGTGNSTQCEHASIRIQDNIHGVDTNEKTFALGLSILIEELQKLLAAAKQFGGISSVGKLILRFSLISKFFYHSKRFRVGIDRCVYVMINNIISPIRGRDLRIGRRGWDFQGIWFSFKSHLPDKRNNASKLLSTYFIKVKTFTP